MKQSEQLSTINRVISKSGQKGYAPTVRPLEPGAAPVAVRGVSCPEDLLPGHPGYGETAIVANSAVVDQRQHSATAAHRPTSFSISLRSHSVANWILKILE
jgi:hypothetical protein